MSALQDLKVAAMILTGLGKDALHVHVGLLLFFASAALLCWPIRGGRPWLVVLVATLVGEAWDIADTLRNGDLLHLADNRHDILNTMFWPTLIVLLARFSPILKRA